MKAENYFKIHGWMISSLTLSGNELLIYAAIYGLCENGTEWFYGSLKYLCEKSGASRRTVLTTLKSLIDRGLLEKRETARGKTCEYKAVKPKETPLKPYQNPIEQTDSGESDQCNNCTSAEIAPEGCRNCTSAEIALVQELHGGSAEIAPEGVQKLHGGECRNCTPLQFKLKDEIKAETKAENKGAHTPVHDFQNTDFQDLTAKFQEFAAFFEREGLPSTRLSLLNIPPTKRQDITPVLQLYSYGELCASVKNYIKIRGSPDCEIKFSYADIFGFLKNGVEKFADFDKAYAIFAKNGTPPVEHFWDEDKETDT